MKLSKAQQKTLEAIQRAYTGELAEGLEYYSKGLERDKEKWKGEMAYLTRMLETYQQGFILWKSNNSRTLERLAEEGYIEYIKRDDRCGSYPLDLVRLK